MGGPGHIKYYKNFVLYVVLFIGIWLGLGLGKLRYHTGGPGGLPPGLGFGLGKLKYRTGVRGACPWVRIRLR